MIQSFGHEIGSHGYDHKLLYYQTPESFRDDIRLSISLIEGITGEKPKGFRAPVFSIVKGTIWALDILAEEGFVYDSSIFPIIHDRYGVPNGQRFPHRIERKGGGTILEFPLSTLRVWKGNFPVAGGGYLRLLPYWVLRAGVRSLNRQQHPAIIYLHPWELDPGQPKIPNVPTKTRIRHFLNLHTTANKLRKLIRDWAFEPICEVLKVCEYSQKAPK